MCKEPVLPRVYECGQAYPTAGCLPPLPPPPAHHLPLLFHKSSCEITLICWAVLKESSLNMF